MYDAMGDIMDSGYRNPGIAQIYCKIGDLLENNVKNDNCNKRNKNVSFYNKTGWNNAGRLKPDLKLFIFVKVFS